MSDIMRPMSFEQLLNWTLTEHKERGTVFGEHHPYHADARYDRTIFERALETPVGPAAGPHTQLAQNIVAAYYTGSRFFELKTVQIMDGADLSACVNKPCIKADDECYNCEWSTELYVPQAMEEYIKAWFLCKVIAKEFGLGSMDGFNTIIDYFNRMAEELSGTETLRTDFISNVSHELKTPLAVIQNYGNMLAQPGLSEGQRREYAEAITDTSRRLANLITNILKLNKLENQQIFPTVRTYSLSEQLCECFLSFEGAWDAKNLEIETDLAENVMVDTDAELLSLVWNNLFSNAIKFTEPGGLVSLSLKTEGSLAIVTVSDTGCGISRETGAHIFEKFYQGDTSHAIQGNGLGLALVKRVIDIIGAEMSVESEVGKGSTFIVKLKRSLHES